MKCRQGNHQLDNQSVSQLDWEGGRPQGRQSVRQSVSQSCTQSVRHSLISYAVSSGNQVAACHLPVAYFKTAKTVSTWCPCQYVYPATPMPQQLPEPPLQTAAAATKVNQMSAEPPLRFNGADVVCHFGANVIPNTQTVIPSPLPSPVSSSLHWWHLTVCKCHLRFKPNPPKRRQLFA